MPINKPKKDPLKETDTTAPGKGVPGNGGVPTNSKTPPETPNQAGGKAFQEAQEPNTSLANLSLDVSANEDAAQAVEDISSQEFAVSKLVEEGLKTKQRATPIQQQIAKINERVGRLNLNDYKGMPLDKALTLMQNDFARFQSQKTYFQTKLQENEQDAQDLLKGLGDLMNSQLTAAQMVLANENDLRDYAFQPAVLLAGIMPPGLPEKYRAQWEAASNKAKADEAYARRPKGTGAGTPPNLVYKDDPDGTRHWYDPKTGNEVNVTGTENNFGNFVTNQATAAGLNYSPNLTGDELAAARSDYAVSSGNEDAVANQYAATATELQGYINADVTGQRFDEIMADPLVPNEVKAALKPPTY